MYFKNHGYNDSDLKNVHTGFFHHMLNSCPIEKSRFFPS